MEAPNKPVANPTNVDNLPGSPQHTVNKPVVGEANPDPNPGAQFNRPSDETTPRRDNTAVNQRDQDSAAKTPFDQGQNSRDVNLTAEIRQKIVNHSGMSINGRNVKIISENGKVTLRGPVDSQTEKDHIDEMAKDSAGAANVANHLEVVAPQP